MKTFKSDGNVNTRNMQNLKNGSASGLFLDIIFSHRAPKKIVWMETRTVKTFLPIIWSKYSFA